MRCSLYFKIPILLHTIHLAWYMHMPNINIISHSFVRYTHSYSDPRSTAPPATTNSPEAIPPGNSSTTAVVLTLLAIAIVLVVVLVLVFYKETRR